MSFFVVHALDGPGKAAARAEARPSHRARLREHNFDLMVHVGGPLLDHNGQMCGSLLVIEANDKSEVAKFLLEDPYTKAGVYHTVEIHEFEWGLGKPEACDG